MKTEKQHWIPKFILKGWEVNNKIKIEYLDTKIKKSMKVTKRKINGDNFFEKYFYESDNKNENEIEDKLGKIESHFSKIINKIDYEKGKITLTRKDLETIKFFLMISTKRTKTLRERTKNKEGDSFFNQKFNGKSDEEINEIWKEEVNKYLEFYLARRNSKTYNEANKLNPEVNDLNGYNIFFKDMSNNSLKFIYSEEGNFILNDGTSTQIIVSKLSAFYPASLIDLYPINKNIIIALLRSSSSFTREKNFDFLANDKKMFASAFNISEKKFFTFDGKTKYINFDRTPSWEDTFAYPLNIVNFTEINVLNAYQLSQARELIIYNNEEDLENAKKIKEEYHLFRIEDDV